MLETEAYRVWQCECPECCASEEVDDDEFEYNCKNGSYRAEHICYKCDKTIIVTHD